MAKQQQQQFGEAAVPSAGPPSPKRARLDMRASADVVYDPPELTDFLIQSSDGKKLAVHKAFILRYSKFFVKLLEACPEDDHVAVSETAEEFTQNFLDILYDRDKELQPENVLRVLELADKYEAPKLIIACRGTLCSDAFVLTMRRPGAPAGTLAAAAMPPGAAPVHFDSEAGHCSVLDALVLASKYDFDDLFHKCQRFVTECSPNMMLYISTVFAQQRLKELKPDHLVRLVQALAGTQYAAQAGLDQQREALAEEKRAWEREREGLRKATESSKEHYQKLLTKYNKLIAKAKPHGVMPVK